MSKTCYINYALNKFCPYLILFVVLFWDSSVNPINAILAIASCFFIDKFSFKTGYSLAYCEAHNIRK